MSLLNHTEILQRLKPIKIPLAIILCALILLLSTGKGKTTQNEDASADKSNDAVTLVEEENRLSETLQTIEGVGHTRVLLSCRASAQTEYVTDGDNTVILSAGSGKQNALEKRTLFPEYLGAVIVCEGGDDPKVQWSILEAVSQFTGLRSDQITVLKLQE